MRSLKAAGRVNLMFWTDENSYHFHVVCFFLENSVADPGGVQKGQVPPPPAS